MSGGYPAHKIEGTLQSPRQGIPLLKSAYSLSGCNILAELMDMFESMCHIRFFPCLGDNLVPVLKLCANHFDHYLKSFTKGWRLGVSRCLIGWRCFF